MTTIVYRNGILAADTRAYSGDKTPVGSKTKIHQLEDGTLVGISTTNVGGDSLLLDWVRRGSPIPATSDLKPDTFMMLMVKTDGTVWYANDNLAWSGPLRAEFFAIGSGNQFALGALAAGADALQAVRIACDLDPWSSAPIDTLNRNLDGSL